MTRLVATLVVVVLPSCSKPAVSNVAADSAAVMAALEQYRQAWLKGDTAAALGRISDDIRIMIGGLPDIVGKDATRRLFADEMAKYEVPLLTLHHQDVIVSGDHAIDIGTFREIQLPKTGAPIEGRGRFMTIWRREGSEWRIVRYMLN
jgi:ketosteroid isomerase-like protein